MTEDSLKGAAKVTIGKPERKAVVHVPVGRESLSGVR